MSTIIAGFIVALLLFMLQVLRMADKALEAEERNELYLILTNVESGRQVKARLTFT